MQILIMQLHTQWGRKLRLGEVNRSTSSAKGREQILTTPNLTPSTPWQWLETLFMAKGNPGRMQHPPGSSVSHFWQCCHYSCRIVWDNGSNTAFSQSTGHRRRTRMLSPSPQNICRLVGQNAKHFWYSCDDKELDHWSIARMKITVFLLNLWQGDWGIRSPWCGHTLLKRGNHHPSLLTQKHFPRPRGRS